MDPNPVAVTETLKVLLSKNKENTEREFAFVSINSTTKTVLGPEDSFDKSFQKDCNRIDNWISEESGWIIESIDAEYVNVFSTVHYQEFHTLNCLINNIFLGVFFGVILNV